MTTNDNYGVYIIAEIGINHEGNLDRCLELVKAAHDSGANAVKLQTIDADENYAQDTLSYKIFRDTCLSRSDTEKVFLYAQDIHIDVFTTVGDINTANWINELNPSAWKISSSLLTHIPLIEYLSALSRPLYLSTGIATTDEIDLAVDTVRKNGEVAITLMHCTSIYPTPNTLINLGTVRWLSKRYKLPVGYSDHTLGLEVSCLSVAAGAVAIEKHFTFDSSRKGLDHAIALDPPEFSRMVEKIRITETIMGDSIRAVPIEILEVRRNLLRHIVAGRNLPMGHQLTLEDLAIKRTNSLSDGLPPNLLSELIGRKTRRDVNLDEPMTFQLLA
jgi:sialic acid synthase SpsE